MNIDKSELKKIVKESHTYADVCRKIGWKPQGGNYKFVKKYINEIYNLQRRKYYANRLRGTVNDSA